VKREGYTLRKRRTIQLFGKLFGFEYSFIFTQGRPYLERWIIYCGGTLRLHRFHDGDEPVPHDHPWWFVTFPLRGYWENYTNPAYNWPAACRRYVKPFRFHYRPASFQHFVNTPPFPVWTIVITGDLSNDWGFYPDTGQFVPYYEWSKRIDS
jgi:hypothetical protein